MTFLQPVDVDTEGLEGLTDDQIEEWFAAEKRRILDEAEAAQKEKERQEQLDGRIAAIELDEEARGLYRARLATGNLAFMDDAVTLREAFEAGIPEAVYAIDTLLPENGNATLVASNKTGKTTMMNHLMKAMVDGIPFLGQYKVQPGRVAFWNYEVSNGQWTRWAAEAGISSADDIIPLHLRGQSVSLRSKEVQEKVIEWLASRETDYWILDPGHRACVGFDSEKNDDVLAFTEILDVIKDRAGVKSIILPLHTGKPSAGGKDPHTARGAARWGDWPDAIWTYSRTSQGGRTLSAEGRDVELAESMITFNQGDRSLSLLDGPLTDGQSEDQSVETMILTYLERNPEDHPTRNEIGNRIGKGKNPTAQAADRLEGLGKIHYQAGLRNSKRLYLGPATVVFSPSGGDTWTDPLS